MKNIRTKSLGSRNKTNVVLACLQGLMNMKSPKEIAMYRDKDVKETISSFDHTAKTNSLQSYESAYQLVLNKMKEFLDQSYPNVVLGVLDNIIKEEVKQTGKRPTNTMSSYVKAELETILGTTLQNDITYIGETHDKELVGDVIIPDSKRFQEHIYNLH